MTNLILGALIGVGGYRLVVECWPMWRAVPRWTAAIFRGDQDRAAELFHRSIIAAQGTKEDQQ